MTIFTIALIVFVLSVLIWRSFRYLKRARQAKRWCSVAYRKWLLAKADECELGRRP
jgi:hypothetical protein